MANASSDHHPNHVPGMLIIIKPKQPNLPICSATSINLLLHLFSKPSLHLIAKIILGIIMTAIIISPNIFNQSIYSSANSDFARSRRGGKPESLLPPPQHFIVRFAGGVARFGKLEVVVFYSTRTFTGLITRFPPPATVYHLPFSSLIFSDTPDVIYPTTYFSPVSISVKTTSVSQSPLTFTVPNSGCICSDLIMPSSFASTKVCFF